MHLMMSMPLRPMTGNAWNCSPMTESEPAFAASSNAERTETVEFSTANGACSNSKSTCVPKRRNGVRSLSANLEVETGPAVKFKESKRMQMRKVPIPKKMKINPDSSGRLPLACMMQE